MSVVDPLDEVCECGHPRRDHDKVDTDLVYGFVGECLNTDGGLCSCEGFRAREECPACEDSGTVCEAHPDRPWGYLVVGGCECGAPGMPCSVCCSPIPQDGTHSIVEAFIPDRLRAK